MTPYQKAITGIDEKARDKLIRGLTMTKPATLLKIAGEIQMKALSHDMGLLRRENERLKDACTKQAHQIITRDEQIAKLESDRARLIEALQELVTRCDGEEGIRADGSNIQTMAANALLRELEGK